MMVDARPVPIHKQDHFFNQPIKRPGLCTLGEPVKIFFEKKSRPRRPQLLIIFLRNVKVWAHGGPRGPMGP